MLIGKPVSRSPRQPIPQPEHRQYPLRLVGFLQLLPQQLQSTPPARAATQPGRRTPHRQPVSIHAAREGGEWRGERDRDFGNQVSIHAAREGGDHPEALRRNRGPVSIHAAREGGDKISDMTLDGNKMFQSTPPARAATKRSSSMATFVALFQSTPPARAATISWPYTSAVELFQSTPPARAATRLQNPLLFHCRVSIHAAREGGDPALRPNAYRLARFNPRRPRGRRRHQPILEPVDRGFNPRRPRGRRPSQVLGQNNAASFQSTPPARAATSRCLLRRQ